MGARRGQPPKATAADWSRAALSAIADSGVAGVNVERLSRVLGVTKGSFYGYFPDRDALIASALELWEAEHEARMIAPLRAVADPVRRFELMAASTLLRQREPPLADSGPMATDVSAVELSLMNDRDREDVADALARVVAARVDFLTECLTQIGHAPSRARQLAVSAYTLSLGAEVLRRNAPAIAAETDEAHVATILAPYLHPQASGPEPHR